MNIFSRDGGEGLGFDPLGEVVDPDQEKLCLPFAQAEWVDNVHSPDGEQSRRHHVVKCFGLEMGQEAKLLTLSAFIHIVTLDGRPVVPDSDYLRDHHPSACVICASTFMDFLEDVLCLLLVMHFNSGLEYPLR